MPVCTLADDAAGLQQALVNRIVDDERRGAVLDRLAGIDELGLAEDGTSCRLGRTLELDQRRVADGGDYARDCTPSCPALAIDCFPVGPACAVSYPRAQHYR
jgi:hypothetical protein